MEYSEALKLLCCTCLSRDRKLFQLYRLVDGVNNLYSLLSYDAEAFKEGFYKDTGSLQVCWECKAMLSKISRFRHQACSVQKQLTDIADGRTDVCQLKTSLSKLKTTRKEGYDVTISDLKNPDNFVDCGPASVTMDDDDDIPLSELHHRSSDDEQSPSGKSENEPVKVRIKKKNVITGKKPFRFSRYFTTTKMSYEEMVKRRNIIRAELLKDVLYKCESCIEVFETDIAMQKHVEDYHAVKENHSQCSICLSFTPQDTLEAHVNSHFVQYKCKLCEETTSSAEDATDHIRKIHGVIRKLSQRKPVSKSNKNPDTSATGFKCPECDKYFTNKSARWKHIQRQHRSWLACDHCGRRFALRTDLMRHLRNKSARWKHIQRQHRSWLACDHCGRKFALRTNLMRHLRVHESPPPREPCEVCNKLIRSDLVKVHARIHTARETCVCRACDKTFVSRASYEHHLKYTRAHAPGDILKHKCPTCGKGYRSRGELRDHLNYQHRNLTQHQCGECGKALATRRCVTRHVRRAHRGLKESARDKICQLCGKAFRDKKGLREHELIHSGSRPLSCELCGGSFRQSASLYTHRKRVHKIYPERKTVQLLDTTSPS